MRPLRRAALLGATVILSVPSSVRSQEPSESTQASEALLVFMDCRSRYCDFDHFRREINWVNYVRNPQDAQIHVLVTTRRTGSGGDEFTISYIGQREFEATDDSLLYFSSDTDVFDEVREGLTRMIALGLVRYAARLPTAERLSVAYEPGDTTELTPQTTVDPWNFWIFRVRVGGSTSGEQRQRFMSFNGSLSANRTTEEWKFDLWARGWYSDDFFEFDDGSTVNSIFRNISTGGFVVKSITDHWSAGGLAIAEVSTFFNLDFGTQIGPAIEYNIYPYVESTRRAFTINYAILFRTFNYEQITIFGKLQETRFQHNLEFSYTVRQPWGSSNLRLEARAFVDEPELHNIALNGRLNFRLFRGFEFNVNGGVMRVKDQIFLPAGGATEEEILLRRQALGTDYRYWLNLSFSYTFGSIYNNIVNPRFD